MYIHIHIYIHVCVYIYIYIHIHTCVLCIYIYIYVSGVPRGQEQGDRGPEEGAQRRRGEDQAAGEDPQGRQQGTVTITVTTINYYYYYYDYYCGF